jgi:hypothetical protein
MLQATAPDFGTNVILVHNRSKRCTIRSLHRTQIENRPNVFLRNGISYKKLIRFLKVIRTYNFCLEGNNF